MNGFPIYPNRSKLRHIGLRLRPFLAVQGPTYRGLIIVLFSILTFSSSLGQNFRGHVVSTIGHPVSYANVLIKRTVDSTLVTGAITDSTGLYDLVIPDTLAPNTDLLLHVSGMRICS